jgi:hypothetical protein
MKLSLRYFWRSAVRATRATVPCHEPPVASDLPAPGEVLTEIGLLLAIHLAMALAITLTLPAFGIP